MPTDAQSFPLPVPSPGYRVSGKEVEVCCSGSRHPQLCGCHNLQLIQSHVAPSHGPPARVLSPLFFLAKSLLLPKPHCPSYSLQNRVGPLFTSEPRGPLPFPQNHMVLLSFSFRTAWSSSFPIHFIRTTWTSTYLLASELPGSPPLLRQSCMILSFLPQNLVVLPVFTCFRTSWFSF